MVGKVDNLEQFAKRIETRLKASGNTDSIERLICRLLTNRSSGFMRALSTVEDLENG